MYGGFGEVGDDGEKFFFFVQGCLGEGEKDAKGSEEEGDEDKKKGREAGFYGVGDVYGGAYEDEEDEFGGEP